MEKKIIRLMILAIAFTLSTKGYAGDSVQVNNLPVVHKGVKGITTAFPDPCKTPSPGAPSIPIPYPNTGMVSDTKNGSKKVKMNDKPVNLKDSNFNMSTGDEAGTRGKSGIANPVVRPNQNMDYPRTQNHIYFKPSD